MKTTKQEQVVDIAALCDQALELERRKKLIESEQKTIEKQIKAHAKKTREGRIVTDGGGWTAMYPCTDGSFVRVTKDGDTLASGIKADADGIDQLKELVGGAFGYLFTTQISYRLVPEFRAEAMKLIPDTADRVIDMVSTVGKTNLSYHAAKKVDRV